MTPRIALGLGGIAGWNILKRTSATQKQIIANDVSVKRANTYFRENISKAQSAGDLVKDYRLLSVALGAFGLESDIRNRALIQKVLESDITDRSSLVNRLSDKRYLRLAEAFGYGAGTPKVASDGFGDDVATRFIDRELERRVGQTDEDMRLALNARRELAAMAGRDSSDKTLWFEILGNQPLRKVFETAFGLDSKSFGKLPVDRQHNMLMERAEKMLGSSSFKTFADEARTEKLVRNFLVRAQVQMSSPAQNAYSAALTLLSRR